MTNRILIQHLEDLDWCCEHGLTNKDFWRIHQFRNRGDRETIASFRAWVVGHNIRQPNILVLDRCKFMRGVCESLDTPPDWATLAEAAWFAVQ